jgi:hypothetical protein
LLPKVLAFPQTSHFPATAGLPSSNRRETRVSDGVQNFDWMNQ